jgi:two-component system chemotaxis response regulator CheB
MHKVKVLIVDDSATMRAVLKAVLRSDPEIDVIGEAADAYEAREAIKQLNPDVVTLDIEMPRMSGLQFLEKIMTLRPMPVIMISSLTQKGATDSIEALSIGAFDCIGKPLKGDVMTALADLPKTVKAAAKTKPRKAVVTSATPQATVVSDSYKPNDKIVAIGSSTGGVEALLQVLSSFPAMCPPTVITQHMPETFLCTFAERLNKSCAPKVSLAEDQSVLKPGHVYLAPGGRYHLEVQGKRNTRMALLEGETVSGHRPSVDVLFKSVAAHIGKRAVGVILTGMGRDGARGLLEIHEAGGQTIGQDEATSVVYGMPRVAFEKGAVQQQRPLARIGESILSLCRAEAEETR